MVHAPPLKVELASGLDADTRATLENAFAAAARHLEAGFPPGAAAAVCGRDGLLGVAFGGWASLPPEGIAVERGTIWDLASLTKVMVTTQLCRDLERSGSWSLDDPLQRWLPAFRHPAISLRHCLTHVSGLPAHRPFWEQARGRPGIEAAVLAVDPEAAPGEQVVYSDLNFMLLGWAVEACAAGRLEALWRQRVARRLGLQGAGYRPRAALRRRIAASEVWGAVHDENARALGGISGHAGLFAPLDAVARFAQALIAAPKDGLPYGPGPDRMGAPPEVRGLGWRLQPMPFAPGWPAEAFGHTGFTGTSIVASRSGGLAAVLLTNAVHPERRPGGAAQIRADFYGALAPLAS